MKTFLDNEDADIQVELIPLLDVVFCLLAVFILGTVGLSRPEGINLNLPKAETGTPQFSSKFRVQVGILGELLANNQPVNQTQLKQLVSRYLQTTPQGVVILKADGGATYDQVITVLDMLRSVGGERVALETVKSDPVTLPVRSLVNHPVKMMCYPCRLWMVRIQDHFLRCPISHLRRRLCQDNPLLLCRGLNPNLVQLHPKRLPLALRR